jgi:hypothetical protein
MGFEPTIPILEWATIFHALDRKFACLNTGIKITRACSEQDSEETEACIIMLQRPHLSLLGLTALSIVRIKWHRMIGRLIDIARNVK